MSPPAVPDLRRRIWRVVRIAGGSILMALGVVGLFLPLLQGVALIIAGLAVLATELPWARRLLHALRERLRLRRHAAAQQGEAKEEGDAQGGGQAG